MYLRLLQRGKRGFDGSLTIKRDGMRETHYGGALQGVYRRVRVEHQCTNWAWTLFEACPGVSDFDGPSRYRAIQRSVWTSVKQPFQ